MEDIIQPIINGKKPEEILELVLDKANIKDLRLLEILSTQFSSLESLSLRGIGLTSLENFPPFPKLKKLELSDNKITDGLHHLSKLSSLVYLNLGKNKIRRIRDLEPLSSIENLQVLNLMGCAVTNTPDYQIGILTMLPSLKSLDKVDNYGNSFHNVDNDNDDSQSTSEDERFSQYGTRTHSFRLKEEEIVNTKPKTKPPPQNGKLYKVNETADEDLSVTPTSSASRNSSKHSPSNYGSHHVASKVTVLSNSNSNPNNNNSKRARDNVPETFQEDDVIDISSSPPASKQEKSRDPNANLPFLAPNSPNRMDEKEEEKKRKEKQMLQILVLGEFGDDSDDSEDDEFEPEEEDEDEEEESEGDGDDENMSEEDSDDSGKKRKAPTPDIQPTKKRK